MSGDNDDLRQKILNRAENQLKHGMPARRLLSMAIKELDYPALVNLNIQLAHLDRQLEEWEKSLTEEEE